MSSQAGVRVGFAGLGAMGFGMASNLVRSGYQVTGFDVYPPTLERFQKAGGASSCSPREAARKNALFVIMVTNAQQAESVLFDEQNGAASVLPQQATILLCSTVPSAFLDTVQTKLSSLGRPDIHIVDCPVSGGTVRAANGTLTILSSGTTEALSAASDLLQCMSEKLYTIPGGIGAASNVKLINQLLAGVHIATAAEAMGLAASAGLNTREVYDIIVNAAGNSWMFENRVPHMLDNDFTPHSALNIFVKDMGIVTSTGRAHGFPLPISASAEQLYLSGAANGYGAEDDAGLVRMYLPKNPAAVYEQTKSSQKTGAELTPSVTPLEIAKVGFIGLGAMGSGMAASLVRAGYTVQGYDVYEPSVEKFVTAGGKRALAARSPAEAASDAQIFILMVQNASQAEDVLFGAGKAADSLPNGAIVILSSTVPPSFTRTLGERLVSIGRDINLVDAPVSGGVVRAASGELTIISSGSDPVLASANPVLSAMSGPAKNLCRVQSGVGAASSVKLINQLLAGVHIAAAAEAMAFGAKLGLETRSLFEIISNAAGGSWMFGNRVPAMLEGDWTPHSALAIFVKDLGIVLDEAKRLSYSAPMSAAAHQLYLFGSAKGWTKEADSGVVRIWEEMAGVSVAQAAGPKTKSFEPQQCPSLPAEKTIAALPKPYSTDVVPLIRQRIASADSPVLVVLDDDPTGTQTCHDITVLTVWDHETLLAEFQQNTNGFFILTNSRALPGLECTKLILGICENVTKAAAAAGKTFNVVLRGDSTLRGHIPEEPEAAEQALGEVDAWILAPFFFEGGRYTIDDVHYVKENDTLVPAADTPFAKDATFGYKSSNMRDYLVEKAGHRFNEQNIFSISISDIRTGGPDAVTSKLLSLPTHSAVIVNAAAESDMLVFAAGLLAAEQKGKKFLYRTAAAFVSARLGITAIEPLTMHDLGVTVTADSPGGLIVAGSYVPKTTAQLAHLRSSRGEQLVTIELDVSQLIASQSSADAIATAAAQQASTSLAAGHDVLIMTSRALITGATALSSLAIGSKVAAALVAIVQQITTRPRYLIAKGGITSSDAATKGLGMKKATVLGQAAKGVPLWRCEEEGSRWCGVPYVVFPGNVGGDETLGSVVERWAKDI